MAIETLYTGKGLAAKLPDSSNAMKGLTNFIAKAEETKFNVFQKNKDAFMKMTDVDPVMFLTTANQATQAENYEKFKNETAKIYKDAGGYPSTTDMQQIQAKRNYLMSEQQKMQADMEQAMMEREIIEKDNGANYDPQEWYQNKYLPYIESGKWDKTPMVKRAKPIESVFKGKVTGAGAWEKPDPDNPTRLRQTSASKKDVAIRIADTIFMDESVKRHAMEEWRGLPESEKERYFNDLNNDGLISEEERQQGDVLVNSLDNPIIKSYVDKHWANLVNVKFTNKQRPPSVSTSFKWDKGIGAENNRNGQYDVQSYTDFDGLKVDSWINLGKDATAARTQQIQEYIDPKTGEKKSFGSAAEIRVVGYSPDKDMIIAQVTENSTNRQLRENKYIGLPGARYDDLLRGKPFGVDRESLIKQYGGTKAQPSGGLLDEL